MRVLLVGCGGSGSEGGGDGACMARTRRFEAALRGAGHEVETIGAPGPGRAPREVVRRLRRPDDAAAVVAISPYPAEAAVRSGTDLPMWIDMNGMHPAEVQLDAEGDYPLHRMRMARILSLESTLLRRGDAFSTPSGSQRLALVAELFLTGRLDASRPVPPVFAIPHCISDDPSSGFCWRPSPRPPREVFTVLSAGSFNKWFDHVSLLRAMETAMDRDPRVRFAATGGAIPHSPGSFDEFAGMVASSRHRGRFELHGWLPRERLEEVYASADAAVYMDLPCAESDLGARTRVLDWIARGLPVLCTRGSDISRTVESEGLGAVVPQGDSAAMADAVLALASDPGRREAVRARQEAWSRGPGSCRTAFAPLLDWAARPERWRARPLVRGPVPVLDSLPYRILLFRELVRLEGPARALGRILSGRGGRRG